MARDFEDAINLDQLSDDDVRDLVVQRLDEYEEFDIDDVEVDIVDGRVVVEGRVGTEADRQHVEQVLTRLGTERYDNNVVVDESRRKERAEAADMAREEDAATQAPLGEPPNRTSDTAQHLDSDATADQFGTSDMREAIEEGKTYTPPDQPVQEGFNDPEGSEGGELH